jgi:hypothetical protein
MSRIYLMLKRVNAVVSCGTVPRGDVTPAQHLTATQLERARGADAWWLVEAESADAARYLIAESGKRDPRDLIVPGRILDQGGTS